MMANVSYSASVGWGPRLEAPEQLAPRLIEGIQGIRAISPVFAACYSASEDDKFLQPLELSVARVAERIGMGNLRSDDGTPNPRAGYSLTTFNSDDPRDMPSDFMVGILAGSSMIWSGNSAYFSTADSCDADPSLVTFDLFKNALLILADSFGANFGGVFSSPLADLRAKDPDRKRLGLEWMTYLGPRFAHFANPPPSAIVERRPSGGLFMAATDEVFSTDDPEHMAVARDIQAGISAFNALKRPYPGLELPED